jgi:hypothetical protein
MEPYFNNSYGPGFEGVVDYVNTLTDFWFVPVFLGFILIALIATFSKDKQFPMSAVVAFSLVVVMLGLFLFKLVTSVSEIIVYVVIVALALAVAWGWWSSR